MDCNIPDYFRDQVEQAGGGNYQTVINNGLRDSIEGKKSARPGGAQSSMRNCERFLTIAAIHRDIPATEEIIGDPVCPGLALRIAITSDPARVTS